MNNASRGPSLNEEVELSIGEGVTTPAGYSLRANRIAIKQKAVVRGDVYFNQLEDSRRSTSIGQQHTPLSLPVIPNLPPFQTATPGTQDVTASQNQTVTLPAGNYRDVVLKQKCTLILNGGVYNLRNLDLRQNVDVLVKAPTTLRVAERFAADQKSYFGPDAGSGIGARDIVVHVNGVNGRNGHEDADPEAVRIGQECIVRANFYAPNGTLSLRQKSQGTGAFIARDVIVGEEATLVLASAFGPATSGTPAPSALSHSPEPLEWTLPALTRLQSGVDGTVEFRFNGAAGVNYAVETSGDLVHWTPLAGVLMGQEGVARVPDPDAADLGMRFYRVIRHNGSRAVSSH